MERPNGFEDWWSMCLDKGNQLLMPVDPGFANKLYHPELGGRWRPRIDPTVLHHNYHMWVGRTLRYPTKTLPYRNFRNSMLLLGCRATKSRFGSREPRPVFTFKTLEEHRATYPSLTR